MSAATVLIVDDNAPLARSVAELLSRRSFRTVVAGTASAGLRLARRLRPDLVIVDVDLPDVSGRELSRRLARLTPPVPVILVTAADEAEADPVPSSAGVVATLGKPFDPLYLLSQVRRALRRAGSRGLECPPVRLRGAPLVRERRRTWRAVPARWLPPGGSTLVGPAGNG